MRSDCFVILLFFLAVLSACGNPSWVIPEDKMEDMLFDIHLADAEIEKDYQTFGRNELKKQELYNAIFEKYDVTTGQFDTSLVWYSANLDDYMKMYERLEKRFRTLSDTLSNQARLEEERLRFKSTANVWEKSPVVMFDNLSPLSGNVLKFRIDTLQFETGDTYELRFETLGMNENISVTAGLYAMLADTTLSRHYTMSGNGRTNLVLALSSGQIAESLSGFIYVSPDSSSAGSCPAICNIILNRRKSAQYALTPAH